MRRTNFELCRTEQKDWEHDLHPKTILQGDDVGVIIGLIEEVLTQK